MLKIKTSTKKVFYDCARLDSLEKYLKRLLFWTA
jgi:hypothetical protein